MNKQNYLQKLAIPVWQNRQKSSTQKPLLCALIKDAHNKLAAILISEDHQLATERHLLEKIAHALSPHFELIDNTTEQMIEPYLEQCKIVIFDAVRLKNKQQSLKLPYSLATILASPACKKTVWDSIKFLAQ